MLGKLKTGQRAFKLISIMLVFVLIYLLSYLMNPFSDSWKAYTHRSFFEIAEEIISGSVLSWAIIEISVITAKMLDKRLSWTVSPLLRFVLQVVLVVIAVILLLYIQDQYYIFMYGDMKFTMEQSLDLWQFFVVSVIVSLFVSTVHTGYFFLQHWKHSMSETAELRIKTLELKEVAMQAELQSLKLQLDPHFMFNNFSTLSELINEDKALATSFLDNLSRVYRYMILNLKKDLVQLEEELHFVNAYNYLIKIRHGNNVQIEVEVDEALRHKSIPPISLQLLIENAIKHNRATVAAPLVIKVTADVGQQLLIVRNNLQRIPNPLQTTKLGLNNIFNRYEILSVRMPQIIETATTFEVALPLLD